MGSYDATFDATNIPPEQGGAKHPVGNKFPATVTDTDVMDTKDNSGKYFSVTFTTPAGNIKHNYNLWNSNKQAVDIAAKQLSALCHASGIFQINMRDGGKNLRGAKCLIDVGHQAGHEPSAEKPEGGFVEVKKIYDVNGNEPGKQQGAAPQQQQPQQPTVQQGWNNGPPAQQQQPNAAGGGWQPPAQQQPQPNQPNPGWGSQTAETPPWGGQK